MKKVLYTGAFDPFTVGHLDVAKRMTKIFDEMVIAVSEAGFKKPKYSTEERVEKVKEMCAGIDNIKVVSFDDDLLSLCEEHDITCLVRGIRNEEDLKDGKYMVEYVRKLSDKYDVIFCVAREEFEDVSSTKVREEEDIKN